MRCIKILILIYLFGVNLGNAQILNFSEEVNKYLNEYLSREFPGEFEGQPLIILDGKHEISPELANSVRVSDIEMIQAFDKSKKYGEILWGDLGKNGIVFINRRSSPKQKGKQGRTMIYVKDGKIVTIEQAYDLSSLQVGMQNMKTISASNKFAIQGAQYDIIAFIE